MEELNWGWMLAWTLKHSHSHTVTPHTQNLEEVGTRGELKGAAVVAWSI